MRKTTFAFAQLGMKDISLKNLYSFSGFTFNQDLLKNVPIYQQE